MAFSGHSEAGRDRHCLLLISARERALADGQGCGDERPYDADEPAATQVVPIATLTRRKD